MKRPRLYDYNLNDSDSQVDYIMAWNEYSNMLLLKIKELEDRLNDEIKCPDCGNTYVHIPSSGLFWCEECGYIKSNN